MGGHRSQKSLENANERSQIAAATTEHSPFRLLNKRENGKTGRVVKVIEKTEAIFVKVALCLHTTAL